PTATLLLLVVALTSALWPTAMLWIPVVRVVRAWNPKAVFWVPVVVLSSALVPPAVLPSASLTSLFGGPPQLGLTPSSMRPMMPSTRRGVRCIACSFFGEKNVHGPVWQTGVRQPYTAPAPPCVAAHLAPWPGRCARGTCQPAGRAPWTPRGQV